MLQFLLCDEAGHPFGGSPTAPHLPAGNNDGENLYYQNRKTDPVLKSGGWPWMILVGTAYHCGGNQY